MIRQTPVRIASTLRPTGAARRITLRMGLVLLTGLSAACTVALAQHDHAKDAAPRREAPSSPSYSRPSQQNEYRPAPRTYSAPRQPYQQYVPQRGESMPSTRMRQQQPFPSNGYVPTQRPGAMLPERQGPSYVPRPLITAQPPEQQPVARQPYRAPRSPLNQQQHLPGWLQSHQGESFAGQEQSLRQEPGFSRLPQPQQQRLIDRLHQLDTMPPQQRQRTLSRIENMERLSPDRRQQVRSSAEELGAMPPGRRQEVRSAFRSLRDLPPEERQQQLASPAFRSQYNERERQILGNLLSVEPYNPQ